jgi:outer membrane protein insertion porin family
MLAETNLRAGRHIILLRVRSWILILALAGLAVFPSPAAAELEGQTVAAIEFEPRSQPLTPEQRQERLTVQVGQPLHARQVAQSIRNLFATGRYTEIAADTVAVEGGVRLVFRTQRGYFIGEVDVTGVPAPPSRIQLINAANLKLGEPYWPNDIAVARQSIRELLAENGFPLASINVREEEHPESQQVDIVFEVTPGTRAGIGNLIVVPGAAGAEPPLTAEQVRRITGWSPGKDLTQRRLLRGLDRLQKYYQRRDYWQQEARIVARPFNPDTNQIDLVLHLVPGPRLLVRVEGSNISQKQLRRYVPVFEEGMVDEDLLAEGERNLRDYLQTQGYFSAEINHSIERRDEELIQVVYRVTPGPRQRLVRVAIAGNRYFDRETIQERMLIQERNLDLRRGRFSESLLERDKEVIRDLYRSNGFRGIEVTSRVEQNALGEQGNLAVFFQIHEGRQTRVEELTITGAEKIPQERFYYQLASVGGQPFSEVNVATDRDLILAEYFNAGYQDADLVWTPTPTDDPYAVRIEYTIREGDPLYVRQTIVSGLEYASPALVERQIQIRPDEPLSQGDMFETQRRLYDLGIFAKVDVGLQNPSGDERSKNVLLQLEESRRWTLGFGGGAEFARIGGDEGTSPLGEASFSPRATIELTRLNVRGIGHTLSLRTRFSNLQQRALITYQAPRWTGSDRWHMTISGLLDTSREFRTFKGRRLEGAMQLRHQLSKPSTALYRFTYRRTVIDEIRTSAFLNPLDSETVRVGLVSGTYIQDRRDDPTNATRGLFNTVDLSLANGAWGSEADFFRFLGQNSTYHRLRGRVVLARTLQMGLMIPTGSFDEGAGTIRREFLPDPRIPLSERFFSGGANTHRGFPINQSGPRDPITGFPIGGGAQFLNSVELRFPLRWQNMGGVLFHDVGNVYSKLSRVSLGSEQKSVEQNGLTVFDYDYMVHAVGVGLRYRTPIGPVRLDFGYSVNPPRFAVEDAAGGPPQIQRISHFQFHFSVGQTF